MHALPLSEIDKQITDKKEQVKQLEQQGQQQVNLQQSGYNDTVQIQ